MKTLTLALPVFAFECYSQKVTLILEEGVISEVGAAVK